MGTITKTGADVDILIVHSLLLHFLICTLEGVAVVFKSLDLYISRWTGMSWAGKPGT